MQQNQIRRIIFVCIIIMLTCFGLSAHNILMIRQQVSASSTEKYYSGDWEYQLDENNKVIITGYTGSDTELTIDEIDGKEVSVIGSTVFSGNKIIEKVILGE